MTNKPPAAMPHIAPPQAQRPAFARHAASLIVLRTGPLGFEALMGLRGAGHRFMPNRLVFPGGAVDYADANRPAAAEPRLEVLAMLGGAARPRLARALILAAARELEEETGLSLGNPPRLDAVDYLCRAVTPTTRPIRFNARFFIVDAAAVQGEIGGSGELEGVRFFPLSEALALDLALVTREVLDRLSAWLELSVAERQRRASIDVFKNRRWRVE